MKHIRVAKCKPFKIALVVSEFNEAITTRLYEASMHRLEELGFNSEQITTVHVPGAVEIPLVAQHLAISKEYNAIVALGAVIKGETDHYHWVCEQVSQGCQRVSLEYNVPVVFGVLTTNNHTQAMARSGGEHSNKGAESIDAACAMVSVLSQL